MSQYKIVNHPKLTAQTKANILEVAKTDEAAARKLIRKAMGISRSRGNEWFNRIKNEAKNLSSDGGENNMPPQVRKKAKVVFSGEEGAAEIVDPNVRTLEDLLKICKVDLETWEVKKHVINKWEVVMREPATTVGGRGDNAELSDGGNSIWTRGSHIPVKEPLYQVKAWLEKRKGATDTKILLDMFKNKAEKFAPKSFAYKKPGKERNCLYVLNIQDLHLSKLANHAETGESDWDIRIAERAFNTAVADLMDKAPRDRIEEVVVIVGSDMVQVDNDASQTSKGTYVDSDSRLSKTYDVCTNMLVQNIEKLAQNFKVRVIAFPGNHDSTVSLYMGYYIAAWFRNNPNVVVDKGPKSRKYVGYGKNLIAFDHGDEARISDLPLTIMRENQQTVSQYKFIECLTGHLHKDLASEYHGVKVRIAPALCPADRWHARKGFVGNIRTSQGLLYQKDNGLEAIYYSAPVES